MPLKTEDPQDQTASMREMLEARGFTFRSWAIAHGYLPNTVYAAIRRWAHRPDCVPHGGLSRQIMADLRKQTRTETDHEPSREAA